MNKRTGIFIDALFVLAMIGALSSFASALAGNGHFQLYYAIWACFCLLLAVLFCVYPRGRA